MVLTGERLLGVHLSVSVLLLICAVAHSMILTSQDGGKRLVSLFITSILKSLVIMIIWSVISIYWRLCLFFSKTLSFSADRWKKILILWNNFVTKIMASPWRCSIERVGGKAGRGTGSWIVGTRSKLQCRRATVDLSDSCSVAPKRDNNLGWTYCTCRSKNRTNNMEGSEREIKGFHCYHYSSPFEHHYRLWSDFDHEKWRDRWDRQFWTTNKRYVVILNFQFKKWVHHYIFLNRILVSRFSLFQSIFANFFIRLFK